MYMSCIYPEITLRVIPDARGEIMHGSWLGPQILLHPVSSQGFCINYVPKTDFTAAKTILIQNVVLLQIKTGKQFGTNHQG